MVAGWIKKIAINKGKEYARNWVMEHKFLVGFGKQTLPFQLILNQFVFLPPSYMLIW